MKPNWKSIIIDTALTGVAYYNYTHATSYGWAVWHGLFVVLGAGLLLGEILRANTPPPAGA